MLVAPGPHKEVRTVHVKGHIREALIESLEETEKEWYRHYRSKAEALRVLGRLWKCTDIVDQSTRGDFADQVQAFGCPPLKDGETWRQPDRDLVDAADRIRDGCTYAQLVRILRPLVQTLPDW
jgi:hypothetical protein